MDRRLDNALTYFLLCLPEAMAAIHLALAMAGKRMRPGAARSALACGILGAAFFLGYKALPRVGLVPQLFAQVAAFFLSLRYLWGVPISFAVIGAGISMTLRLAIQSILISVVPIIATQPPAEASFLIRLSLAWISTAVTLLAAHALGTAQVSVVAPDSGKRFPLAELDRWKAVVLSTQVVSVITFLALAITLVVESRGRSGGNAPPPVELVLLAGTAVLLGGTSVAIYFLVLREIQARRASEMTLSSLVGRLPGIVYGRRMDGAMPILYAHAVSRASLAGAAAPPALAGLSWRSLVDPEHLPSFDLAMGRASDAGGEYSAEYRICLPGEDPQWVWDRGSVLEGREGPVCEGYAADVSARKDVEARLSEANRDKERLVRELFHRTGNALQSVSSLMRLKAAHAAGRGGESLFEDLSLKIDALAIAQDALCSSRDLFELDLARYLRDLVDGMQVRAAWLVGMTQVELELGDISVSIDAAGPLGVVVTELLVNSARHGAAGRPCCRVRIKTARRDDEAVELEFEDDGPGLPTGLTLENAATLGLPLSSGIVTGQLRGEFRILPGPGFRCVLSFPSEIDRRV